MLNKVIKQIEHGLIVSCQAEFESPFNSPESVTMFAKAAILAGAVGIRSEGIAKTKMILESVNVPVIGLLKSKFEDGSVRITGSFSEFEQLTKINCPIIAIDGTFRKRNRLTGPQFIQKIKRNSSAIIMADIATIDEALECEEAGADFISTTLNGYTPQTAKDINLIPNFELVKKLSKKIKTPLIAEGRIYSPESAREMIRLGAHAVVVGTAITRPQIITSWYVKAIKNA